MEIAGPRGRGQGGGHGGKQGSRAAHHGGRVRGRVVVGSVKLRQDRVGLDAETGVGLRYSWRTSSSSLTVMLSSTIGSFTVEP